MNWRLIILGATTLDEEEVGWDEDDEDESDVEKLKPASEPKIFIPATTTTAPAAPVTSKEDLSKPKSSIDRTSQPDSESSYDVVSGVPSKAPSQAASSPTVAKVDCSSVISLLQLDLLFVIANGSI